MPKITAAGGPTHEGDLLGEVSDVEYERACAAKERGDATDADRLLMAAYEEQHEGSDESSPGKNSSASETKPSPSSEKSEDESPSTAPATAPRSTTRPKGGSAARSAAGRTTDDN